ncbi:MAG: FimB/Mfa2 family fimbrial subunit [Mediterranea sp.]|nr:FimB/Mfa2 family fimbrial subunit [Mediterranea sp.]
MIKYICYATMVLLLTGCYSDTLDDCPPDTRTVTLHFAQSELHAGEQFTDRIGSVHVTLFDDRGVQLSDTFVTHSKLAHFAGVVYNLAPGNYQAVAWGNVDEEYPADGMISYDDIYQNTRVDNGTGDCRDFWYGEHINIAVPETEDYETTLSLSPGFWDIDIYVEGTDHPVHVELRGLPTGADARTGVCDESETTFSGEETAAASLNGAMLQHAGFRTFRFAPYDADVELIITNPTDGTVLYRGKLRDLIPVGANLIAEIRLPLQFTFHNEMITITFHISDWDDNDNDTLEY